MTRTELIGEIQKLPLKDRMYIIEFSMRLMRREAMNTKLGEAAENLIEDYVSDEALTAFTSIDQEDFYEPK